MKTNLIKTVALAISLMVPTLANAEELNKQRSERLFSRANTSGSGLISIFSVSNNGTQFVIADAYDNKVYVCSVTESRSKVNVKCFDSE